MINCVISVSPKCSRHPWPNPWMTDRNPRSDAARDSNGPPCTGHSAKCIRGALVNTHKRDHLAHPWVASMSLQSMVCIPQYHAHTPTPLAHTPQAHTNDQKASPGHENSTFDGLGLQSTPRFLRMSYRYKSHRMRATRCTPGCLTEGCKWLYTSRHPWLIRLHVKYVESTPPQP